MHRLRNILLKTLLLGLLDGPLLANPVRLKARAPGFEFSTFAGLFLEQRSRYGYFKDTILRPYKDEWILIVFPDQTERDRLFTVFRDLNIQVDAVELPWHQRIWWPPNDFLWT